MGFRVRERSSCPLNVTEFPVTATETWKNANTGEAYASLTYTPGSGAQDKGYELFRMHDVTHPKHHGKYLNGGDMSMCRFRLVATPVPVHIFHSTPYKTWTIDGQYYPVILDPGTRAGNLSEYDAFFENDGSQFGAEAFNRFKPGKPKVSLSVFLAELRDLPQMLMAKSYAHRNLGKHYLAAQFGWLPFVSDIRKMIQTYHQMDRIMNSTIRANGKWLLRRGVIRTSNETVPFFCPPSGGGTWGFSPGTVGFEDFSKCYAYGENTVSEQVWFSGRFRYYIPGLERKMQNPRFRRNFIRKVYGLTITPADLWEAMPWSWLIDYFANVGDVMNNISSGYVDAVAKYAYVMKHNVSQCTQTSIGAFQNGTTISGSVTRTLESKHRVEANPFGLEVGADLSPRQLAILAALGISRA